MHLNNTKPTNFVPNLINLVFQLDIYLFSSLLLNFIVHKTYLNELKYKI